MPSPTPEVFLKVAELLGLAPESCLVVEDATSGAEAAHAGGFACAGVGEAAKSPLVAYPMESIAEVADIVCGE